MDAAAAHTDAARDLLRLYDRALPEVYGYLAGRCGAREVAEELTSETFLAAADAARRQQAVDVPWLIGVARHKLADHWRRQYRDRRNLQAVASDPTLEPDVDDPWDACLDALRAAGTLAALAPQHRVVLTFRYVDDLPVADVAALMDRTLHATEALLVRARAAFRRQYTATEGEEDGRD